jgi:acyl carrier protein
MDRAKLRQTLRTLAKRITGEAPEELADSDVLLKTIGFDSFSFIGLVLEIEGQFDISLPDEEVQKAVTVGNLLDLILSKIEKTTNAPAVVLKAVVAAPHAVEAAPSAIRAAVRAVGCVDVPIAEVGAARERLAQEGKDPRAQSVLRLCDDQTVLGALAMREAMRQGSIEPGESTMWNLIASSRFLGRLSSVSSWRRFEKLGPSRMSPLVIPFVSLHAGAGVLSLYFQIHGPTFGVGGCADNVSEGLLTGLTAPISAETPGTWMVFTAWEPEPVPNDKGQTETPSRGYAVAIALTKPTFRTDMQLTCEIGSGPASVSEYPSMRQFVEGISRLGSEPCRIPLSAGGTMILEKIAQARRAAA